MSLLFSFLGLFFWFLAAQAVLVNITIDDSAPNQQVIYTPPAAWNNRESCNDQCLVRPEPRRLNNGSWHESTFGVGGDVIFPNVPLTASVSFNGSAVYVFCALARANIGNSDMTFYLDGVVVGAFAKPAIGSAGFDYAAPVYANVNIPPGLHTLTVQNGHQNGPNSLMVLDSIVFSQENGQVLASQVAGPLASAPATSSSGGSRGPSRATLAVAGVLIFALVLLLVGLGIFLVRRRRRRRAVYARYMPKGSVQAFPSFIAPSPVSTPGLSPLPPVYGGGSGAGASGSGGGNWWVGRDQKTRDGTLGIGSHRPYADLDPAQAGLQRPQTWERSV
ncbi:hypothetical protein C8R43DRAFT_34309 [Mycena crocata]|nr:hypothetical protein C8R43DRAFT_34309 [Mycena crocata]